MKDCNCGYCMGGEILAGFGIKICDLKVSQLILFKEQSHPGRVIVAYKDHVSELVNISAEERALFFEDVATAANAIHKAFSPDKVNYGAYGDGGCHLHFHLVPTAALHWRGKKMRIENKAVPVTGQLVAEVAVSGSR